MPEPWPPRTRFGDDMTPGSLSERLLIEPADCRGGHRRHASGQYQRTSHRVVDFRCARAFDGQARGMAGDHRDARSSHPGRPLCLDRDRHVVVADPVRPRRRCRALRKIIAYSGCDGLRFHAATGASDRLRVSGGMSGGPGAFLLVVLRPSAASVPARDGRRAGERQRRSKRMFCAMRLRAGAGRRQRVGWRQPAARRRDDDPGPGVPGGHLHDLSFPRPAS